jgi:hypothetical protein
MQRWQGHCADVETPNEADAQLRAWMDETKAELASMGAKSLVAEGYQAYQATSTQRATQEAPNKSSETGKVLPVIQSVAASTRLDLHVQTLAVHRETPSP